MSLFVASLNSGSNGNCYYVGNKDEAILVDIGISCRETEKRLSKLKLPLNNIKAIFISHEHTDHIRGVNLFAKKHKLPVYVSRKTFNRCKLELVDIRFFEENNPVYIKDLIITPFLKAHDGIDPHSFTVDYNGVKVGVFTDIGKVCDKLTHHFSLCNAAFLETNYCEEMLDSSSYPYFLKARIKGGNGHLSNAQALELFKNYGSINLKLLLLSHLSKENNNPQTVKDLFDKHSNSTKIVVASRYQETEVFEVCNTDLNYPSLGDTNSLHYQNTNSTLTPQYL